MEKENRKCIIKHTSGSTGMPKIIIWDEKDYYKSIICTWRYRKKYNIRPFDNYVTCHCAHYINNIPVIVDSIIENNKYSFCKIELSKEKMDKYLNDIVGWNPKWLMLQPNIAYTIGEYMRNNNINIPSLEYVEITGDYCDPLLFDILKSKFKYAKLVNHYGTEEVNSIGYCENNDNVFDICSDNVDVSIISINGIYNELNQPGKILVSSKHKQFNSVLNYDTGDYGKLVLSGGKTKLHLINARRGMQFHYVDKIYDSSMFYLLVEYLNMIGASIYRFKFIHIKDKLICLLSRDNEFLCDKDISIEISEYLKNTYGVIFCRDNIEIHDYNCENKEKYKYFDERS